MRSIPRHVFVSVRYVWRRGGPPVLPGVSTDLQQPGDSPPCTQAAFAGRATPKWCCSPTTAGNLTLGLFPETGGFELPPTRSG